MQRTSRCPLSARSGHRDRLYGKKKGRLESGLPKLSWSAGALRQAGASPEGKVRLLLRRVRRDLQRFIGDLESKYLSSSLLESHRDVCHGIPLFMAGSVTARLLVE